MAYYLLDVVNVGSVVNNNEKKNDNAVGQQHYYWFEEDEDEAKNKKSYGEEEEEQVMAAASSSSTPVNTNCVSGGGSILARIFTFHCGTMQDVEFGTTNDYYGQDSRGRGGGRRGHYPKNNNNNNNYYNTTTTSTTSLGGEKRYKLTKKLVQDFQQAVKFRMDNIIETNNNHQDSLMEESEVVIRTREIAAKIEAYGLPGMPPPPTTTAAGTTAGATAGEDGFLPSWRHQQPYNDSGPVGSDDVAYDGDCYDVNYCDEEEEEEEDEQQGEYMRNVEASRLERRRRNEPRHFPILPTDDDEGVVKDSSGGMDENERRFYNTYGNIPTMKEITHTRRNSQSSSSPFKTVHKLFSTLVGPSSRITSTPSKEQCQIRLQQIQREISNAERMMESSRSTEVISACVNRINKLRDEERMYQIYKEIYKIQAMMQATESESVKKACSQRLYQLTAELKSIDLDQYDEELDDDKGTDAELDARNVARATGGEDLGWYERAQQYVRIHEKQSPRFYHHTAAPDGHMHHYPHQYPTHHGYIPNVDENYYYDRHYSEKQHFSSPVVSPRRVLSPRNGRPYPASSPRRQPFANNHYPPYY